MKPFWRRRAAEDGGDLLTDRVVLGGAPRWRLLAVLLLSVINAFVSGTLLLQHHGEDRAVAAVNQVCGEGPASGCEIVAKSPYSEVRGVPVAALGAFFSLSLAVLMALGLLGGRDARDAAAGIGLALFGLALAAAVVLLGVQFFLIRAFCRVCLLTYAVNALAFFLLLGARHGSFTAGARDREARLAVAGWALASVALAAGILAFDRALDYREEIRAAVAPSPLGGPGGSVLPPASPLPPGSEAQRYQEEARAAQEQARQLQEVLDDPRKLEEYFSTRASREFEQAKVQQFDYAAAPAKGPPDAPIRVVEFSDFLCPFCRSIAAAFDTYIPQAGQRVVVHFKHYPLDQACNPALPRTVHPGACTLALGGICAQQQGRFWPYHDRVFRQPPNNPSVKDVAALAGQAGLDAAALEACMGSGAARARLAADIEEAGRAGVAETPTLFINGRRLPRINDFSPTVDREAARMGLPPVTPRPGGQ